MGNTLISICIVTDKEGLGSCMPGSYDAAGKERIMEASQEFGSRGVGRAASRT